jgi:putative nucleotidyltransferase with HDIG domain
MMTTGAHEVPLALARRVLAEREAWLVGGLVRDLASGAAGEGPGDADGSRAQGGAFAQSTAPVDLDVVVRDDPAEVARALARAGGGASFALSEQLGAWRVVARDGSWQIDVEPLRGETLEADLKQRDFTVNAVAQSLDGSQTFDPLGGLDDLARRLLRTASPRAFADDPLRALRLVRLATTLSLEPDGEALAQARASAAALASVSPERVFAELKAIVDGPDPLGALTLLEDLGITAVVLPELAGMRGVEQSRFHHRDVLGHTLEVLDQTVILATDPAAVLGAEHSAATRALLEEPLADGLSRAGALRWGALLHDAAKPQTRAVRPDGRVTFVGHDLQGAELARSLLRRLRASERLCAHVAGLVRHHLRLGFLVHEPQPLDRRVVYGYLRASEPVEVDVTLLSVADRLATRGDGSEEAIDAHLTLARSMLSDALSWRESGAPRPLWRGDALAAELGIARGPRLGELLEAMREAQYAGAVSTRAQALAHARDLIARGSPRA